MTDTLFPATHSTSITEMSAVALSDAIRARDISCVEVMDAFLAQVDQYNDGVNAIVSCVEPELLRDCASKSDALLADHRWLGPLHGIPQAPKDILPAAGMVTTRGSPLFQGQVSSIDAVVFERMRASGAIFIGRTNTPEFGLGGHTYNPIYGTTRNAWNPALSAGGSSGGAAVAVALRMLAVADGSDMMGSLRTPAAFNGVWGLRTTPGCVPYGPGEEVFLQQFTVAGPMGRSPQDMAMLLSVQAGYDSRVPTSYRQQQFDYRSGMERDFSGVRVAWLGDLDGHLPMEPGLLAALEPAKRLLQQTGCIVEPVSVDFDMDKLWEAWLTLRSLSVAGFAAPFFEDEQKRRHLKPEARWEIERGLSLRGIEIYRAHAVRTAWYQALQAIFKDYEFLMLPSTQVTPFDAEMAWPSRVGNASMQTYHEWLKVALPATMAGLPALATPAGFNEAGIPVGVQIIGKPQADWSLLQLGHAYDAIFKSHRHRPPMLSH